MVLFHRLILLNGTGVKQKLESQQTGRKCPFPMFPDTDSVEQILRGKDLFQIVLSPPSSMHDPSTSTPISIEVRGRGFAATARVSPII